MKTTGIFTAIVLYILLLIGAAVIVLFIWVAMESLLYGEPLQSIGSDTVRTGTCMEITGESQPHQEAALPTDLAISDG